MNAYELADIVDRWAYKESAEYLTDAATLIRQQADLIRNLQKSLGFKNSGYETINLTPPVAWMSNGKEFYVQKNYCPDFIPLYTHPAETITLAELRKTELYRTEQTRSLREFLEPKELTDEEIKDFIFPQFVFEDGGIGMPLDEFLATVRAILRKAQEK